MPVDIPRLLPGSPQAILQRDTGDSTTGFFAEDVTQRVDWNISSDEHTAIIHLDGPIHQLESEIEGMGGKVSGARPGELWLVPAGSRYHSQAKGGSITYAVLTFSPQAGGISPQIAHYDSFLLGCLRRMAAAMSQSDAHSTLLIEQLQSVIQTHLVLSYAGDSRLKSRRISGTSKFSNHERRVFIEFINDNLLGGLRLHDLANKMGRSIHQLHDACCDAYGMAPARVVMEQRLRRARELLASSQSSITLIAADTGFSSHSHLIRAFQQHYSLTPGQFRTESKPLLEIMSANPK